MAGVLPAAAGPGSLALQLKFRLLCWNQTLLSLVFPLFYSSLFTKHQEAMRLPSTFCQASLWHTLLPPLAGTVPTTHSLILRTPLDTLPWMWGSLCQP